MVFLFKFILFFWQNLPFVEVMAKRLLSPYFVKLYWLKWRSVWWLRFLISLCQEGKIKFRGAFSILEISSTSFDYNWVLQFKQILRQILQTAISYWYVYFRFKLLVFSQGNTFKLSFNKFQLVCSYKIGSSCLTFVWLEINTCYTLGQNLYLLKWRIFCQFAY